MPPSRTPSNPPHHLSEASKRLWRSLWEDRGGLAPAEERILQAACEAWDRGQMARRRVQNDGAFYEDRFGQPAVHPGIDVERKARNEFRLLMRELGIQATEAEESEDPLDSLLHSDGRQRVKVV